MTEKVSVKPKILELQSTNDVYMTMKLAILSTDVNANKAQFTDDFIDNVIENQEKYVGIPFLASKEKLENGDFDNLTHELNYDTGKLETDQIGSFVNFWKDEIDGATCLMGEVRIFKRFPEVCASIKELYADGLLETSCEVLVSSYAEISDDGVRSIHYNDGKNALIGSAIVTTGAEKRAKPTLLVAEAYKKDIEAIKKGDDTVPQSKNKKSNDNIEVFNKGIDIKYHGTFELSGLKIHELEQKIFNLVNPVDTENGGRDYNYWIRELYTDSVIFESEKNWNELYKAKYTVDGETVTLANESDWIKGSYGFIPETVELNSIITELSELKTKLNDVKGEKETMSKELEAKVAELQQTIDKLESDLEKSNGLVVSEQEEKQKLEEQVTELNGKVEELKTYKENFEKAEKEKQQKELSEKYVKLFDEETFKSEDVQKAIEACDVSTLNSKFVEVMAKKAEKQQELANKQKDDTEIEISAAGEKDLVEVVKDSSYWASPAK